MSICKHYSDYLVPKTTYKPVMTKEVIDESPDNWLSFYPHPSFVAILRALVEKFTKGDRSIWITGTYGSGKSYAALVLQKLFNDDEARVKRYLDENSERIDKTLATALLDWRKKKVLAIYEPDSTNMTRASDILFRVEKAVIAACRAAGMSVPAMGSAEAILARVERDEKYFFAKRDEIQGELLHLTPDITTAEELRVRATKNGGQFADGLLADADAVLKRDSVFLPTTAERLLDWIDQIRQANDLAKVVFLWDEFSTYVDKFKDDLKTFEQLAEGKAQQCGFHFIPITHMGLDAFFASGSKNAEKSTGRFDALSIEIPAGHVFHLGESAFIHRNEKEWRDLRDNTLWPEVKPTVEHYMVPKLPSGRVEKPEDFKCVLPMHPMSAILLMRLAETVGQSVRSFFDYLRATGEDSEFEKFLREGGPEVPGRQILAADYLWRYFTEKKGVNPDPAVMKVSVAFQNLKRTFSWEDGCKEERVCKAAFLYTLLDSKASGADLTAPTVDNLVEAFRGDGSIVNVKGIIDTLTRDCHAFAVVNGHIQPYTDDTIDPNDKEQWRDKFSLVCDPLGEALQKEMNAWGDSQRFVVRCHDVAAFKHAQLTSLGDYGNGSPKGGNKIAVIGLFAKDQEGKLALAERAAEVAKSFAGLRVCVVVCPEIAFNDKRASRWEDFIDAKARYEKASNETTRNLYKKQMDEECEEFVKCVRLPDTKVTLFIAPDKDGDPVIVSALNWRVTLKDQMLKAKKRWFPESPDEYSGFFQNVFKANPPPGFNALKSWALAGITGAASAQYFGIVQRFKSQGIEWSDAWSTANPNHELTHLRECLDKKIRNAISNGTPCSVRKVYLELQRAPWGLERNPYSAVVLGFALGPWLEKGLQWTDNVNSSSLDADTLAEIVAKVVENDGNGEIKGEKFVCKLSKEEKSFVKNVADIFHLPIDSTSTPEMLLSRLGDAIKSATGNTPLWMLPHYIKALGTETAEEQICVVLGDLCEVVRISSSSAGKKDTGRLEKIKAIGELLDPDRNPGLKDAVAKYLEPEIFIKAFDGWLEANAPKAKSLSSEIGDASGIRLREAVSARFAQEASWLWNERDLSDVIAEIEAKWSFIREVRILHGPYGTWLDFDEARETVRKAVCLENRVSLAVLAQKTPFVGKLGDFLSTEKPDASDIAEAAEQLAGETDRYRALFRDASRTETLGRLAAVFSDTDAAKTLSSEDWRTIHDGISTSGAELDEATFRETVWPIVQKRANDSFKGRLVAAWKTATGTESPDTWSTEKIRPAEVLFAKRADADVVLNVWRNPAAATEKDRVAALTVLANLKMPTDEEADARFLERYLPDEGLATMGIPASALAEWLKEDLGDPNGWRWHDNLAKVRKAFVHGSYEKDILPKAKAKVSGMTDKEAKEALMRVVERNPEAGMSLLKK